MNFKSLIYLVLNIFIFTSVGFSDEGVYDLPKTDYKIEYYSLDHSTGFKKKDKGNERVGDILFLDLGEDNLDEKKLDKYKNKKYKAVFTSGDIRNITFELFYIEKDNPISDKDDLKPVLGTLFNIYGKNPYPSLVFGSDISIEGYTALDIKTDRNKIQDKNSQARLRLMKLSKTYLENQNLNHTKYCLKDENFSKAKVYNKKIGEDDWSEVEIAGCEIFYKNYKILRTDQLHSGSEINGSLDVIGKVTINKKEYLIIRALMRHRHDSGTLLYELNEDGLGKAAMPKLLPEHSYY